MLYIDFITITLIKQSVTKYCDLYTARMNRKQVIEGYDYQFVEKLPEACTCLVCTLVQREAHQVRCCGKIYCEKCLDELKHKGDNFNCPNCRRSLRGENKYFRDKNMIRMIRHFAIYCNNKDKGCQWEGLLKDFEKGHLPKCPYQIAGCSNNCGANLQRRELDRHLKEECPRRPFRCPFCQSLGIYKDITGDHTKTCPDYILECPNADCDEGIKRSQIDEHRNECPKEIVPCHHSSIGCNARITREELPSHDQEHVTSHLDLAIKEIHKLRAQTFKIPVIKMQNYLQHVCDGWVSPGFYVSTGSYKMALKISVHTISGLFGGDYLSCELALLPGEYDDTLEWPFQGEVTVELLNQKVNRYHHETIICFNENTPDQCKSKVVAPKVNGGWWGNKNFIDKPSLRGYLDNDTLYFRISVEINTKTNKSWLV